jgi:GNAT superfamily N-acetyltransferase
VGRPGIYLEDLFVLPEFRGLGIGKALLQQVAAIAVERAASACNGRFWTGIRRRSISIRAMGASFWMSGGMCG